MANGRQIPPPHPTPPHSAIWTSMRPFRFSEGEKEVFDFMTNSRNSEDGEIAYCYYRHSVCLVFTTTLLSENNRASKVLNYLEFKAQAFDVTLY